MSLEVDGRPGSVPIVHQREEENLMYLNGQRIYGNVSNAQDPYRVSGNAEGHEQPRQCSKAKDIREGGRIRVRLGFMFRWGSWLALISVLAVVAAGVAGSIAARRGKQFDTWYVLSLPGTYESLVPLTTGAQYEHAAENQ